VPLNRTPKLGVVHIVTCAPAFGEPPMPQFLSAESANQGLVQE
jgi:hypothetical protein